MYKTITAEMTFQELYNAEPQICTSAPGRVNLMGDHTDYNGGYVLPTVIPQETRVELALTRGQRVRVFSEQIKKMPPLEYFLGKEAATGNWIDYIQGITFVLAREGFPIQGFDARIDSDVPLGSGLSSSAALEIAMLKGLREILNLSFNDVELAQIAQRAENDFVGAPVGIMDQMACMLAESGQAFFLNTRNVSYFENVPIPHAYEVVVVFSGVTHHHVHGEYKTRRAQCEEAARKLGIPYLSQMQVGDLPRIHNLPEPLNRRVRHVVTENQRVFDTVEALRAADEGRLRALFYDSHRSLKEDYEVSVPEIDFLVDQSKQEEAIIGARMTGGGFGGCVVILARRGEGREAVGRIIGNYRARFGKEAIILVPRE